jgi:hypothetical protein
MGLNNGQTIDQTDFIRESERNATPSADVNRVPQLEADGRLAAFFSRHATVLNCGETINGATIPVPVYQSKVDNELYACDANDNTRYKFIGFVTSNGTNGNPAIFQGSGLVSGFTALAEGEKYYVQDAVGTIGTTPGTQVILVGVAVSETELLIQKGPLRAAGNTGSFGTASGSVTITTGFRPSKIRVSAQHYRNVANTMQLEFTWVNGSIFAVSYVSQLITDNQPRLYLQDGLSYMTFSITSVTDTGFTITWTETGTFTSTASEGLWEAEGEL